MESFPDASSDGSIRSRITRDLAIRSCPARFAGSRLPVEADLITALGVSRTVVREAVRTLAAKGIVVSRKKAGISCGPCRTGTCWTGMCSNGWMRLTSDRTYMKDIW